MRGWREGKGEGEEGGRGVDWSKSFCFRNGILLER